MLAPDQLRDSRSETGDVLIRSTRAHRPDRALGPGPSSVQITVQKLREPPQVQRQRAGVKPERSALPRAAAEPDPGEDVVTSRFVPGGRGIVLEALKNRCHSAPHRREVRVQLLDSAGSIRTTEAPPGHPALSSQDAVQGTRAIQTEAGFSSGCHGNSSNAAAAAAAAAVAAAAPLIKAQSEMEVRVSGLVDGVQKLLQADRGRSLSPRTLQHLEILQSQQLQLQSQLLDSALQIVTGHASTTTTSDRTALGRPAHPQVTPLDTAANVLSSQPSSMATAAAMETVPVSMETQRSERQSGQSRELCSLQTRRNLCSSD